MIERRTTPNIQFRAVDTTGDAPRQFWARVLNYNTLDTYGTTFDPGAFVDALKVRLPRLLYGHNWESPGALLGRAIDYRNHPDGLDLLFEFDDFDAVPTARQVAYQLRSGTIDQFSIGFSHDRKYDTPHPTIPGATIIGRGALEETSCVVKGSVPGTKTLQLIRSDRPRAEVNVDDVSHLVARLGLGEVTLAEALTELEAVTRAGTPRPVPPTEQRALPGSYDETRDKVCEAICDRLEELTGMSAMVHIVDISSDTAVYMVAAENGEWDDFWQVGYTIDATGVVVLGDAVRVERVVNWVPEPPDTAGGAERSATVTVTGGSSSDPVGEQAGSTGVDVDPDTVALLADVDGILADLSDQI